MQRYPLDIAPEQVVLWLLYEQRAGRHKLTVSASRAYEVPEIADRELAGLGDEDREEFSDVLEIGLLEVTPPPGSPRWTLRIRFEDDVGARLPEDEPVPDGEEEIDLQTFYDAFIDAPHGTLDVSVEVENPAADGHLNKLLNEMLRDRHRR